MADNRTMAQMLQAPIEGYEDAIVVPPINANNFELKQPLINLVQSNKFTGYKFVTSLLTTKIHDFAIQSSFKFKYSNRAIPSISQWNEARAIKTRSGVSYEGPSIPMPPPFVNPDAVEETSTDQSHLL
ncbi:hypothetical protein Tco_0316462 [Tanacetum coccineum]